MRVAIAFLVGLGLQPAPDPPPNKDYERCGPGNRNGCPEEKKKAKKPAKKKPVSVVGIGRDA